MFRASGRATKAIIASRGCSPAPRPWPGCRRARLKAKPKPVDGASLGSGEGQIIGTEHVVPCHSCQSFTTTALTGQVSDRMAHYG